jgi:hypothetical protein
MRVLIVALIVALAALATDAPKVIGKLTTDEIQQVQDAQKDIQIAQLRAQLTMAKACGRAGLAIEDCVIGADWSITKREPPPATPANPEKK